MAKQNSDNMTSHIYSVDNERLFREKTRKQRLSRRQSFRWRGEFASMMRITPSLRDGNCMFDAVALCLAELGRDNLNHQIVRHQTVEYLRKNLIDLDGLPRWGFIDHNRYSSWGDYLNKMSQDGEWGDRMCLRTIRELYEVNIQILDNRGSEYDVLLIRDPSWPTIYLLLENERHYEGLTKVDGMADSPYDDDDDDGGAFGEALTIANRYRSSAAAAGGQSFDPFDDDEQRSLVNREQYDYLQSKFEKWCRAKYVEGSGPCYRYLLQTLLHYISLLQDAHRPKEDDLRRNVEKLVNVLRKMQIKIEEFDITFKTWLSVRKKTVSSSNKLDTKADYVATVDSVAAAVSAGVAASVTAVALTGGLAFPVAISAVVGTVGAAVSIARIAKGARVSDDSKEREMREQFDENLKVDAQNTRKLEMKMKEIAQVLKELDELQRENEYKYMILETIVKFKTLKTLLLKTLTFQYSSKIADIEATSPSSIAGYEDVTDAGATAAGTSNVTGIVLGGVGVAIDIGSFGATKPGKHEVIKLTEEYTRMIIDFHDIIKVSNADVSANAPGIIRRLKDAIEKYVVLSELNNLQALKDVYDDLVKKIDSGEIVMPDAVEAIHLHEESCTICVYVERTSMQEGREFVDRYMSGTERKTIKAVKGFQFFTGCENCNYASCPSLLPNTQAKYRPLPWIGAGSPLMVLCKQKWDCLKAKAWAGLKELVYRLESNDVPFAYATIGFPVIEGEKSVLCTCLHGVANRAFRTPVFLSEVRTQGGRTEIIEIGTQFETMFDQCDWQLINSTLARSVDQDLLKIHVDAAGMDTSLIKSKFKSSCSGDYNECHLVLPLTDFKASADKPTAVTKLGIVTGHTHGNIYAWERFHRNPGAGRKLLNSLAITPLSFAAAGDSGSLVLDLSAKAGQRCAFGLVIGSIEIDVEDRCDTRFPSVVVCSKFTEHNAGRFLSIAFPPNGITRIS